MGKKEPFRLEHKSESRNNWFFEIKSVSFLLILGGESDRDKFNAYGMKKSPLMNF